MLPCSRSLTLVSLCKQWVTQNNVVSAIHKHKGIWRAVESIRNANLSNGRGAREFTAPSRLFRTLSEKPIDVEAFEKALKACWSPLQVSDLPDNTSPSPPHGIGIAVSGGVDSMALAGLCKRLQNSKPNLYRFHAIVVDHKARSGSTQEAAEVQQVLEMMGLTASIRAISWPAEADDPLSLPNFETQARRERYRHLGLECASRGLRYLLLAHHGNDQAEGILGRLVAGYTGSGLEGMKRRAPIPECGGLWGVSEGPNRNQSLEASQTSSAETVDGDSPTSNLNMHTAAAGITIHRPFLLFTKSALRKTCEGLDIQWKEDETNQVLGLTLRNTTRSLFQRQRLPLALQERSLMGLASRKSKLGNRFQRASEDVLSRMHAMAFDPRIGQLTLSLSHDDVSKFSTLPRRPSRRKSGKVDSMSVSPTRSLVNRLAAIVSPRKNIEQDTVSDVANTFIKALKGKGQRRFTGGGVWWRRHADRKLDSQTDLQVWSLCRQPLSRTEQHNPCLWADLSSEGRPSSAEQLQDDNVQPFATWQLLDNRFWLKVEHSTKEPVAARLLDKAALTRFRNSLDKETRKRMHDELHTIAPGDVRFTLPILSDGSGAVLALPTLGYVNPVLRKKLTWEWCYKHIDLSR